MNLDKRSYYFSIAKEGELAMFVGEPHLFPSRNTNKGIGVDPNGGSFLDFFENEAGAIKWFDTEAQATAAGFTKWLGGENYTFFGGIFKEFTVVAKREFLAGMPIFPQVVISSLYEQRINQPKGLLGKNDGSLVLPDNSQELAKLLIKSGRVTFDYAHESGTVDNANANANIHDTANGKEAELSDYGNAPGGSVTLNPKMLKAVLRLSKTYRLNISEFAGGSHDLKSKHYLGTTVDISKINNQIANINNPYISDLIKDARKYGLTWVIQPPAEGHLTHVHFQF